MVKMSGYSVFIPVRMNSQANCMDLYSDSDGLFVGSVYTTGCHYSMSKPNPNPSSSFILTHVTKVKKEKCKTSYSCTQCELDYKV